MERKNVKLLYLTTMKTPRVSILLPVFNAAATLEETLESIQAQSCENFEVVAIDDGSEDGSGDLLLEWSRRELPL